MSRSSPDDPGIVAEPLRPGWLRRCPECRRWLALRPVRRGDEYEEQTDSAEIYDLYRCARCNHEVAFVRRFDPHHLHIHG